MQAKVILVTGGLGYIGSHTCVSLLNEGYDIIVIDNLENSKIDVLDKIKKITNKNFVFHQFDLLDKDKLEDIFKKNNIYAVIHFAGLKSVNESVSKPLLYYNTNIGITLNLLNVMQKYNCKKIIFSSSCTVYGNSKEVPVIEDMETGKNITCPYGKTKYMLEEILKDLYSSDKSWSIILLRYFNPVGAHESGIIGENPNGIPNNLFPHILKSAQNNSCLNIYGNDYDTRDGTCIRDFIHVVDLADGHLKALTKLTENNVHIYNLGTGNGVTVLELVTAFEKVNNIKLNYKFVGRRQGDVDIIFANPTKVNNELKWYSKKTIDDVCRDGWRFCQKNK